MRHSRPGDPSRFDPARKVPRGAEHRELEVKWVGWPMSDNTWERQSTLIEDGHPRMVHEYLVANKLAVPAGLAAAAAAEMPEGAGDDGAAPAPAPPAQPLIGPTDRAQADTIALISTAIGGERPNGVRARALSADATEAQRRAYEASHVTNPETEQTVHKSAAISHQQKQMLDATPGAGRNRYVTGERQPIISEDKDRTGFACGKYYEVPSHTSPQIYCYLYHAVSVLTGACWGGGPAAEQQHIVDAGRRAVSGVRAAA